MEGIDYEETFALVAKFATLRMLLALTAAYDWDLDQMDVATAFLHPILKEEVYMEPPQGYENTKNMVCKLLKALYGLKQAPRAWYADIDKYLLSIRFRRSTEDSNLYIRADGIQTIYLLLWVDDILIAALTALMGGIKRQLMQKYQIKDLGLARIFIGLEIIRD